MRFVMINAGLANQTFQYIFARYLEEATGERVMMDDSCFFRTRSKVEANKQDKPEVNLSGAHNGYELEYAFPYAQKPLLLSQNLSPKVFHHMSEKAWEYISNALEAVTAVQLRENGMDDLTVIFENISQQAIDAYTGNKFTIDPYEFNPDVAKIPGNVYYSGYWVTDGWFNAYKPAILKDLTFPEIAEGINLKYQQEILASFSVGVHIRRGDFVRFGWATPEASFRAAFDSLKDKTPANTAYFIFSDQIGWCKENAKELGIPKNTIFVEGNFDYKNNYVDMQLMSQCNKLVFGASSFSYLASLLNQREEFEAIQIDDAYWVKAAQRR